MSDDRPARWCEMTPARWKLLGTAAVVAALCGVWAVQCSRRMDAVRDGAREIDEEERANRPRFSE
jgi:hypothetical protein